MKSLVWEAPKSMAIRQQPMPEAASDEVLIRVSYAGICGSELSGYLGHSSLRVPPLVMGHEFSGTVAEIGPGTRARFLDMSVGQSVTVNPLSGCGNCGYCARGLDHLCPKRKLLGAHLPGAYAEYVVAPAKSVLALPASMSLRLGALTEPVAVGVRIGEMAGDVEGEDALVVGAGPIGLLALQALCLRGARRVFIADRDSQRLAMGGAMGGIAIDARAQDAAKVVRESTDGRGVAVAVDAVGLAVTRAQCVQATRSAGTVVFSGLHEETSTVPAADIIRREILIRGSFAYSPANFARALSLLATGKMRLDPWIVEAPLEDGGAWFDRLLDAPGNVAKVLLIP